MIRHRSTTTLRATLAVLAKLNVLPRRFIGIEKDPKYAELARDRLRAEENNSTLSATRAGQETLFKTGRA